MARDYILRLIEQVAAAIAGIVAKQKAGQWVQAGEEIETQCAQTIGMDLQRVKGSSPEALAQLLQQSGGLRSVRALTLAELLLLDAELHEPNREGRPLAAGEVHAFCLLADSLPSLDPEDQVPYRAKFRQLADRLGELGKHPYLQERLRMAEISEAPSL